MSMYINSVIGKALRVVSRQNCDILQRIATNSTRSMSLVSGYSFETLKVESPKDYIFHVEMNRPDKLNAMNQIFWKEMVECFQKMNSDPDCRCVVISGAGRAFTAVEIHFLCSGLDLSDAITVLSGDKSNDIGRAAFKIHETIRQYQESFTAIEKCTKPVIAAVHNACIGGGIDLITACDIRYCTSDAWFSIKEVDIGLAADVGTLQRLPKIVGNDSLVRELAYTGRKMFSDEAKQLGIVSRVFPDKETLLSGAVELAELIASKSPIAVQGTKVNLIFSRDNSVPVSLQYAATWNQAMIQSEDVMKSAMAGINKEKATFSKL
ncbi:hypothetical protein LSH36_605g02072 [Paralvinella palmiformis]|uniref:Delta(3,5)-Delta(2,4)-dienoyl-CoA isomerase, mitochondrial n=1 Tax=Paralvinella palmiformis TaxID=53620 RepID=A0AAD9MV14_9ANNE|nr:hypothetical protein LSH36_605g02072 [Paralvinella palmiformis]